MTNYRFIPNLILCSSFTLVACGSGGSDADGGTEADASDESPCGFEDRYLPYQPGYKWTYRVTNLGNPEVTTKSQQLTTETDAELGAVIVQTTSKGTGTTISALKIVGDAVVRLRQIDQDVLGALERTTVYDPGQTRLDEAAARLMVGAAWDDVYTVTVTDELGVPVPGSSGQRTDHWEVLGVDVPCSSPLGEFSCLEVRRQRTVGGVSDKKFFFAKGIGKVKEVNANQVEELVSCEAL